MSVFTAIIKAVTSVLDRLGPALPILLSFIKTKTNEGDREGILKAAGILGAVGESFLELSAIIENSVHPSSEGGTAITGNEYSEVIRKAAELKARIDGLSL